MIISIIVAMADNRAIGINNTLPWHLPADLKHFKATTMGKPIIMGRKTYDSIGRPLPGRTNIVISRQPNLSIEGCQVAASIDVALALANGVLAGSEHDEVMIMGGATLYKEMLPRTDRLYLTKVHMTVEGDAFFPEMDDDLWQETSREDCEADDKNESDYSFLILNRIP